MDCTPSNLTNVAACYQSCIPQGMHPAVQTYLLVQLYGALTGMYLTPQQLLTDATAAGNSFMTLDGMHNAVQTYLLCQIATASGA